MYISFKFNISDDSQMKVGFVVDIKVGGMWRHIQSGKVAPLCIEIDGPYHRYNCTSSEKVLSKTQMRNRHLRSFGWHLISIRNTDLEAYGTTPSLIVELIKTNMIPFARVITHLNI